MLIVNFDTHTYVKKLLSAGVPERQAEIQADTFKEVIDSQLATKKDIKELEVSLKQNIKELDLKIETVKADLKRDIKELEIKIEAKIESKVESSKADIIKWVAGMLVAQGAIVATLVKLLSRVP
ncbi:MAG: DUF1640 domain-containing protein [Desulfobacterales bacterium]|nr:DUF1640 domain-containing protein [Desulfobacterales bacterium]